MMLRQKIFFSWMTKSLWFIKALFFFNFPLAEAVWHALQILRGEERLGVSDAHGYDLARPLPQPPQGGEASGCPRTRLDEGVVPPDCRGDRVRLFHWRAPRGGIGKLLQNVPQSADREESQGCPQWVFTFMLFSTLFKFNLIEGHFSIFNHL